MKAVRAVRQVKSCRSCNSFNGDNKFPDKLYFLGRFSVSNLNQQISTNSFCVFTFVHDMRIIRLDAFKFTVLKLSPSFHSRSVHFISYLSQDSRTIFPCFDAFTFFFNQNSQSTWALQFNFLPVLWSYSLSLTSYFNTTFCSFNITIL